MITHLSPLDVTFWAVQFILEAVGLIWAFRKSLWPLQGYLISRLLMDTIGTFTVGRPLYELTFWVGKLPEYAFAAMLAMSCVGEMLRESRETIKVVAVIIGAVAVPLIAVFYVPVTYSRMLNIELTVNLIIGLGLVFGLATERTKAPWSAMAWGLVVICAASGLNLMVGKMNWDVLARLYEPLEITGLTVLAIAAYAWKGEARISLGVRVEATEQAKGVAEP